MSRLVTTLVTVWRLASPYFIRSDDRWAGRILLAAVVVIELGLVAITVLLNQWNNRFYTALQERNWDNFVSELLYFCVLAAIFIVLAVYQLYLNQWLQIRWRRFMTVQFLENWLDRANHYRMQLLGDAADNPDQRIAEDIKQFIDGGTGTGVLPIGLGFLSSVVTLGSFVVILWTLSDQAPLRLFGVNVSIPGYLVWAALFYAVVGTFVTHLIGRPLIALNFSQQHYEADFRFHLVRVRENSEQIALLAGEPAERRRLLDRFGFVVNNWLAIMSRQKKIRAFTAGYDQVSSVFPFLVVSPAYFANAIQLGGLMQTASAFGSVQGAFSFFVSTYRQIADWRAVIERLDGFDRAVSIGRDVATTPPVIAIAASEGAKAVTIGELDLRLPNDKPLATASNISFSPHEQILVTGPSGSGKSTMLRAIAGIWPFGSGTITIPKGAKIMVLPQRPYLPIGTLNAAITFPALPETYDADRVREALTAVGLPALAGRLDEEAHWNRMLSLGEQQRLGLARALLYSPDYLFLDEATASLDEPAEAALYTLLESRLPNAAIVSIGHRSTLAAFHKRRLQLIKDGDHSRLQEAPLIAAH
ncbi:MAG: ABC transporter ATP-binding protein/permease [Rhizomicrobium sp.]